MLDRVALPGNKFTPFFLDDEKQTLKLQALKKKEKKKWDSSIFWTCTSLFGTSIFRPDIFPYAVSSQILAMH